MKWKIPPKIKIYEALGCIGDKRISIKDNEAKVFSSSRGKFYSVRYDEGKNAIMCNDNGSYWQGYLGYPSIAFLMLKGKIKFNLKFTEALKEIPWKDINVRFKNNYEKTEKYILEIVKNRGFDISELLNEVSTIFKQINNLDMDLFGDKVTPPKEY